jgi:hypothetical protein
VTDLGALCDEHVGSAHPPRCSACDAELEAKMQESLADSLSSDARSRAIVAGYLVDDDWAVAIGEPDPWDRVDDDEPF